MDSEEIERLKHSLGDIRSSGYMFVYKHDKLLVTEFCNHSKYFVKSIVVAVKFAKCLAKERGWKFIEVHQVKETPIQKVTTSKDGRGTVAGISIFAGTPFG